MGLRRAELLESDYIPEAYVFDGPPSLEGSATDVLGLRSKKKKKPWQKSETDKQDYPHLFYHLVIRRNPHSLPHTHTHTHTTESNNDRCDDIRLISQLADNVKASGVRYHTFRSHVRFENNHCGVLLSPCTRPHLSLTTAIVAVCPPALCR